VLRLACCSWSLQPSTPQDLLERVRATGLEAVQLALTPVLAESGGGWGEAVETLLEGGLRIESGMLETIGEDYSTLESIARTGGVRRDDLWTANRDRIEASMSIAAEADLPLVTLHAGFLSESRADIERAKILDRIRMIAGTFATVDINVALETGQETAATLVDVLRELNQPNVGVNFDPANMVLYGTGDPVAAIELLAPWVMQVHIKDAQPASTSGEWGREVRVGDGAIDWPAFVNVVKNLDREVVCVIERETGHDRVADVRHAAEQLRTWWELGG
jgi:sugar phosphate isomerase/epimerase